MDRDLLPTGKNGRVEEIQPSLFDDCGESDEERAFADAYITAGFSVADAYIAIKGREVKRGTARKVGRDWLQRNTVRCYLRQRLGALAEEKQLEQSEVIGIARRVAAAGLGEIPLRKTLIGKDGVIGERFIYEPSLSAVNGAASVLAKFLGVAGDEGTPVTLNLNLGGKAPTGGDPGDDADG